jgi:predicted house-cleaning noncanonical NTP pyrophosphatase (MazG superfamily)
MVDLDGYDSIIIGLKLIPGILTDNFTKDIKRILRKAGSYTVPPEEQISGLLKIGLPLQPLGLKNDKNVEIKLNLQTQSINLIGNIPNNVKSVFEEFLDLLKEDDFEELEDIIQFYEIVANARIKSNNPMDELNNTTKINLEGLKKYDPSISVIGIRAGSFRKNLDGKHISLIIEPKKGSHSSKYSVKMSYQSNNKDDLLSFPLKEELIEIISSLGE